VDDVMAKEDNYGIEPMRPGDLSLDSKSVMNISSDSKNKSVWQSYVDMNGFRQRHPDLLKKKNAGKTQVQKRK
jgi:hypothetical protein